MKVVGVCACPIGIAHTYMAAENLENECKKRGYEVKIETQGAIGIENELTEEEIAAADVVILGIGIEIEGRERFDGKKLLQADVSQCVQHPANVVDKAEELLK